ncbi:MAG: tRNA lysidine(34) synthetase TilS [Candidatus Dadabacteria bacterium]|nr:tRNA lysidine(34) synthetase TilS [Candidatus Dadabacteria bacterium]
MLGSGEPSAEVNLPGGVVFHAGHGVFFFTREEKFREFPQTEIKNHGTHRISRDLEVAVELTDDASLWGAADVGHFAPEKVGFPVTLRSFSEGDRFVPLGMRGAKKLKDFFIDEKIPRFLRKKVPVFETRDGIIWVGGLRMDNRFKADETKGPWLRIRIRGSSQKLLDLAKSLRAS